MTTGRTADDITRDDLLEVRRIARRRTLGSLVFWGCVLAGGIAVVGGMAIGHYLVDEAAPHLAAALLERLRTPVAAIVALAHAMLAFSLIALGTSVRARLRSSEPPPTGEDITDSWMNELFRTLRGTAGLLPFAAYLALYMALMAVGVFVYVFGWPPRF